MNTTKWLYLMELCKNSCHQMPERSFFYKDYQHPICARCLGINIGYLTAIILCFFFTINLYQAIFLCIPITIDVFLQYKLKIMSNNYRRLITGFLGGFGQIYFIINLLTIII